MSETHRYALEPESLEAYRVRVPFHCEELQRETNPIALHRHTGILFIRRDHCTDLQVTIILRLSLPGAFQLLRASSLVVHPGFLPENGHQEILEHTRHTGWYQDLVQ